jgi:hypothetical protein
MDESSDEEPHSDEAAAHDTADIADEEADAPNEAADESDVFEPGGDGSASENNFV